MAGRGRSGQHLGGLERNGTQVILTRGALGAVLEGSRLVLGQAGTANEQAAGLGKPIVAFDSDGRQTPGPLVPARQKGLLGDALHLVDRDPAAVADGARQILQDAQRYAHMRDTGLARLGPAGASATMASQILSYLDTASGQGFGVFLRPGIQ